MNDTPILPPTQAGLLNGYVRALRAAALLHAQRRLVSGARGTI